MGLLLALVLLTGCTLSTVQRGPTATPELGTPASIPADIASPAPIRPSGEPPTSNLHTPTSNLHPATSNRHPPAAALYSEPSLVREIDLALPAGNSYLPRALAFLPGLGRVYVRTRSADANPRRLITALDAATGSLLSVGPASGESGNAADVISYPGVDMNRGGLLVDPVHNWVIALNENDRTAAVLEAQTLRRIRTLEQVWGMAVDAEKGEWYVGFPGRIRVYDGGTMELLREKSIWSRLPVSTALEVAGDRVYIAGSSPGESTLEVLDSGTLEALGQVTLPNQPEQLLPDPLSGKVFVWCRVDQEDRLLAYGPDLKLSFSLTLGAWPQPAMSLALVPSAGLLLVGRSENGEGKISVLQLPSGRSTAEITLPYAPETMAVDESKGQLWVSHGGANHVSAVDLETWQVLGTYPTATGLSDLAVDSALGQLYATDTEGRLRVFDDLSAEQLAQVPGLGRIAVDAAHGRFYVGSADDKAVRVYDAETLAQTGTVYAPGIPVADPHSGDLYVVNHGLYLASGQTLAVTGAIYDSLQGSVTAGVPTPADAVVDPTGGRVFAIMTQQSLAVSPFPDAALWVYEPDPAHPGSYVKPLGIALASPIHVDVDPATGWAYVSSPSITGILVDGRVWRQHPVQRFFGPLRVDPELGHVYMTPQGQDQSLLLTLDATTLEVLGSVKVPRGFTLRALDSERHLLFLANDEGKIEIWSEG